MKARWTTGQGTGQRIWRGVCIAWATIALVVVVLTTLATWGGTQPDQESVFLGQLILAAPASWIGLVATVLIAPQEPFGPDGGGGLSNAWFLTAQTLVCVLVVCQAVIVYRLGLKIAASSHPASVDASA